jgi:SNF2 family DNA or RNA helicase
MPKALVLDQLPPQVNEYRYIEMLPKQKKLYEQMKKDQLAKLEEGGMIMEVNPLTVGMRMMQFASSYAETIETENESGFKEVEVKLIEPSNKIDELLELLEELPEGEPLVVMAPSRQLIMLADERLRSKGYRTCLVVGGLTNDQRQRSIDDFQLGYAQIILCTVGAGGIGLTLTRASQGVFIQLPWSMIEYKQAKDRWHRIGSEIHDKVVVHHFISKGTVEEKQLAMLEVKSDRLEEIVRDRDALARRLATAKEKQDLEEEERILREQAALDTEEQELLDSPLAGGKDAVRSLLEV